jgi:hypothetical protein
MAQFEFFNDLPKELRDQIWDMSIRNDDPAVHFFTMYDVWNDPGSVVDPAKKVHATRGQETHILSFRTGLAAPRGPGEGKLSWTDGNISTYLTDSGLWTACQESRERMLRHFRPYKTSPLVSRRMPVHLTTVMDICDKPTASVNMEFTRDNGERQYLTIRPSTDLICLQLSENSNVSYRMGGFDWEAISDSPSFRWYSHECPWHSSYIMNVAVEYDPAWEYRSPDKVRNHFESVRSAFINVGEINGLADFWFIDYRLKRKYKPARCERGTRKFHAGNLTFIEVTQGDAGWCCCPREGCSDECFSDEQKYTMHGPHEMAYDLEMYHDQRFDTMSEDGSETYYWNGYGVLACVDLGLEGKLPTREEFYEMHAHRITDLGY